MQRCEPADAGTLAELVALLSVARPPAERPPTAGWLAEKLFVPARRGDRGATFVVREQGVVVAFMQSVTRVEEQRGFLGLFAVAPAWRRRGIATLLLRRCEAEWRGAGVGRVDVLGIPGNYAWPGIDPRWTDALCFVEAMGFGRCGDCVNLTVDLPLVEPIAEACAHRVRRVTPCDLPRVLQFVLDTFGVDWHGEVARAAGDERRNVFFATACDAPDSAVVAFAAHSAINRADGFFGPMGTHPDHRGQGLGAALLRRGLADLAAQGHARAVIPWVGPIAFYARTAGARVERVFWRYRRAP